MSVDKGLMTPELEDNFVPLQFRFTFNGPFTQVAEGFLKKHHWEGRDTMTSVNNIKQLDDDRLVFYRRREHY